MKTRVAFAASLAFALLAIAPASYASVGNTHPPMHAMFSKGQKTIKINLRNNTGAPFELKIGDKVSSLHEGEAMDFKLPIGSRVLANTETEHHKVGDLIFEASNSGYSDATIVIEK